MMSTQATFGCRGWFRYLAHRLLLNRPAFKEIKAISERKVNEFWAEIIRENDKLPSDIRLTYIMSNDGKEMLSDGIKLVSGLSLLKSHGHISYVNGWHESLNNSIKSNGIYNYLEYHVDIYTFQHILSNKDIDIILKNVCNQNVHLHQGLESNDDFVAHDIHARRRGETHVRLGSAVKKGFFRRLFS